MRRVWIDSFGAILLAGLALNSCKKHVPDMPESNNPVFRVDGTFDGVDFTMIAGDDNAYMHTSSEIENRVHLFQGDLSDGVNSIQLEIYDGFVDIPNRNSMELMPNTLSFVKQISSPYVTLSKDALPNADLISYINWTVDGVDYGSNDYEIMEPGIYEVNAQIHFLDSSQEDLESTLIVGYERSANCAIKHYLGQNGVLTAWAEPYAGSPGIEKINWFVNGEHLSTDADFKMELDAQSYKLRAEIFFENDVIRSKSIIVDGSLSGKFVDDLSFLENSSITELSRDFGVRLNMNYGGVSYSSDDADNSNSFIDWSGLNHYGVNDQGATVYKMLGVLHAKVGDGIGGVKDVQLDIQYGFALPE